MKLSIVICTRNRAAQLPRCLEAIAAMDKPMAFELVLVDNASTDDTPRVIDEFAATANFPVVHVSEPTPGLGQARDTGWRAAKGEIIALTDDDCYVEQDYATNLVAFMDAHPEVGFFGGRILLHDPEDLPVTILIGTKVRHYQPYRFIRPGGIQGANFGARRALIEKHGGFDVRLGAGTPFPAEDIELVGRLCAEGERGIYLPDVTVRHHHGRRTQEEVKKLFDGYERGAGAYYALMLRRPGLMKLKVAYGWIMRSIRRKPHRSLREIGAIREFWKRYPNG